MAAMYSWRFSSRNASRAFCWARIIRSMLAISARWRRPLNLESIKSFHCNAGQKTCNPAHLLQSLINNSRLSITSGLGLDWTSGLCLMLNSFLTCAITLGYVPLSKQCYRVRSRTIFWSCATSQNVAVPRAKCNFKIECKQNIVRDRTAHPVYKGEVTKKLH